MLGDPVGNEFQQFVCKENGTPYFSSGWNEMGLHYCLHGGGIIRLVYVRKDRMFIKVKDRFGNEVAYPTPPRIFKLGQPAIPNINADLGDRYLRSLSRVPALYHTLSKRLTELDINSGHLVCIFILCIVNSQ